MTVLELVTATYDSVEGDHPTKLGETVWALRETLMPAFDDDLDMALTVVHNICSMHMSVIKCPKCAEDE